MSRPTHPTYTVVWQPQAALLACPVFEAYFGGARGGGKTDGMLGEWASHADLYGAHAIGLMVRREGARLICGGASALVCMMRSWCTAGLLSLLAPGDAFCDTIDLDSLECIEADRSRVIRRIC